MLLKINFFADFGRRGSARTFDNFQSQFKFSFFNFFEIFFHSNTHWYIVVLGRRKNPTLFWASFGKIDFLASIDNDYQFDDDDDDSGGRKQRGC